MNKIFLVIVCLILSAKVFSFNEDFLTYSPISYFTQEDTKLYVAAKNQALNHAKDGEKVSWSNPKSGSYGYFIPSNTTIQSGVKCRQIQIFNVANKVPGKSQFRVCRIKNVWKVVGN